MATTPKAFDPQSCMNAMAAIDADLNELTAGSTEEQFQAPSRDGGWSVGHCIEHLVLTGNAMISRWDLVLAGAIPNGRHNSHIPYSWWHRLLLKSMLPPYTIRTGTAKPFVPCSTQSIEESKGRLFSMHQEFVHRLERIARVDAAHLYVQSPFVSWIRYPLGLSFDLVLAHERRHLWQAWQVRHQFSELKTPEHAV